MSFQLRGEDQPEMASHSLNRICLNKKRNPEAAFQLPGEVLKAIKVPDSTRHKYSTSLLNDNKHKGHDSEHGFIRRAGDTVQMFLISSWNLRRGGPRDISGCKQDF